MTRWTLILFFIAFVASTISYGQNAPNDTTYYQDSVKIVIKKINSKEYFLTTYYKNGQKKSEGGYKNVLLYRKPFAVDKGFSKGKDRRYLRHKHFERDFTKTGRWTYWYSNGQVQENCFYKKGRLKIHSAWSDSGELLLNNQKVKKKEDLVNYDPQRKIKALF